MAIFTLNEVCEIIKGDTGIKKAIPGDYPLVVTAKERASHNEYQFDTKAVCVPLVSSTGHGHASINRIHYQESKFALGSILAAIIPKDEGFLKPKYLYIYLSQMKDLILVPLMKGGANVSLTINKLKTVEVEIPSLEKQIKIMEIVEQIEKKNIKISETLNEGNK